MTTSQWKLAKLQDWKLVWKNLFTKSQTFMEIPIQFAEKLYCTSTWQTWTNDRQDLHLALPCMNSQVMRYWIILVGCYIVPSPYLTAPLQPSMSPSFWIWGYLLHVEHVSCVISNCGQHQSHPFSSLDTSIGFFKICSSGLLSWYILFYSYISPHLLLVGLLFSMWLYFS